MKGFSWSQEVPSGILRGLFCITMLCSVTVLAGCQTNTLEPTDAQMQQEDMPQVKVGNTTFTVEIADTSPLRQKGLMFRESMPLDAGMLFFFNRANTWSFYMKNTLLPLDIIWLDEEWSVVDIQTVQPCGTQTPCPTYTPKGNAQYVLEVNANAFPGQIGDTVEFIPVTTK